MENELEYRTYDLVQGRHDRVICIVVARYCDFIHGEIHPSRRLATFNVGIHPEGVQRQRAQALVNALNEQQKAVPPLKMEIA